MKDPADYEPDDAPEVDPIDFQIEPAAEGTLGADLDAKAQDATYGIITDDRRLVRKSHKRIMIHLDQVRNAAKHLQRLPDPGESVHIIMRGNFNAWDMVPAMLQLAGGAAIDELYLTTLGFNKSNAIELFNLFDVGLVRKIGFICSIYFRDANVSEYQALADGMRERNQRVLAMRNHTKIILARFEDGRTFAIESSANLRAARNLEQMTIHAAEDLFDFHKKWIVEMLDNPSRAAERKRTP